MNRRLSPPLILLLLCTLLAVQFAPLHLHLCVDDGNKHGAALHFADVAHAPDAHPHDVDDREIELNSLGDLRLSAQYGDDLPALVFAVVFLFLVRHRLHAVPSWTLSVIRPARARHLLPPSHAPPAYS